MVKLLGTLAVVVATIASGAQASAADAPKPPVKVPATARWIGVSRQHIGVKQPTFQVIHSPPRVRRIAAMINALAPHTEPENYGDFCDFPIMPGAPVPPWVLVRIRFRAHRGSPLLAEAKLRMPESWCEPMVLKVPGSPRVLLEDGATVVESLHH
jgi:hypothetical protein